MTYLMVFNCEIYRGYELGTGPESPLSMMFSQEIFIPCNISNYEYHFEDYYNTVDIMDRNLIPLMGRSVLTICFAKVKTLYFPTCDLFSSVSSAYIRTECSEYTDFQSNTRQQAMCISVLEHWVLWNTRVMCGYTYVWR